ncbi:urea ABC transporter substrate-binding protein [Streptomyces vinaceus]|uniref:urea ABC transporter substrate-binding protein n=1 Tax=Streptomyces vinaceus TaxID=1960 RepID=UPI0037F6EAC3
MRLGLLHSLTGPMAINERSMFDSEMLAVDEINAGGGVLGRPVEAVVADGASETEAFAAQLERLVVAEGVQAVVGCWTSSSRKACVPVLERHQHLLFYPPTYEGLEACPYIVYTGGAPSQQIIPAVNWLLDNRGRRFFMVGSDYVWPRASTQVITDQLIYQGGELVGQAYLRFDQNCVADLIRQVQDAQPDVIINTLAHGHLDFFRALRSGGLSLEDVPVFSLAVGEDLAAQLEGQAAGGYCVWGYFQSIDNPENQRFVQQFKDRYGQHRVTEDSCHNAYVAVHLWAAAANRAGATDPKSVRAALKGMEFQAPQGTVWVDEENQHLWRTVRIGRARPDGQFDIVWTSEVPVRPVPYPPYRTRRAWDDMLDQLHHSWGGRWECPPPID